jgi:hypothetical protein
MRLDPSLNVGLPPQVEGTAVDRLEDYVATPQPPYDRRADHPPMAGYPDALLGDIKCGQSACFYKAEVSLECPANLPPGIDVTYLINFTSLARDNVRQGVVRAARRQMASGVCGAVIYIGYGVTVLVTSTAGADITGLIINADWGATNVL